jgi:hypothetical protein
VLVADAEPIDTDGSTGTLHADRAPLLVPREVSEHKLSEELAQWHDNADVYRRRGWVLLSAKDLCVDIGFLATVAFGDVLLPAVTAAIRLDYTNYDLWPPSLTFIEPRSGEKAVPPVQALERVGDGVRNALLGHPATGELFLCVPGLREYHSHPQHTGDDWLLHRNAGAGRLAVICDIVWRRMVRNVIGLHVEIQSIPRAGTQLQVGLAQGDVDLIPAGVPAS